MFIFKDAFCVLSSSRKGLHVGSHRSSALSQQLNSHHLPREKLVVFAGEIRAYFL